MSDKNSLPSIPSLKDCRDWIRNRIRDDVSKGRTVFDGPCSSEHLDPLASPYLLVSGDKSLYAALGLKAPHALVGMLLNSPQLWGRTPAHNGRSATRLEERAKWIVADELRQIVLDELRRNCPIGQQLKKQANGQRLSLIHCNEELQRRIDQLFKTAKNVDDIPRAEDVASEVFDRFALTREDVEALFASAPSLWAESGSCEWRSVQWSGEASGESLYARMRNAIHSRLYEVAHHTYMRHYVQRSE